MKLCSACCVTPGDGAGRFPTQTPCSTPPPPFPSTRPGMLPRYKPLFESFPDNWSLAEVKGGHHVHLVRLWSGVCTSVRAWQWLVRAKRSRKGCSAAPFGAPFLVFCWCCHRKALPFPPSPRLCCCPGRPDDRLGGNPVLCRVPL